MSIPKQWNLLQKKQCIEWFHTTATNYVLFSVRKKNFIRRKRKIQNGLHTDDHIVFWWWVRNWFLNSGDFESEILVTSRNTWSVDFILQGEFLSQELTGVNSQIHLYKFWLTTVR